MAGNVTNSRSPAEEPMALTLATGRVLLGLCFVLDGGWWLYSWEVRAAYLSQVGAPSLAIVLVAGTYIVCGSMVAAGRGVRPATLMLMTVAFLIAIVLHTDFGTGGIGEYPAGTHAQINAKTILVQIALVGALVLVYGAPGRRAPIHLQAVVVGRLIGGGYFVANALWQTLYYQTRVEHVEVAGGNPDVVPVAIALQLVFGTMIVAGRALRLSTIPLAVVTATSTIMVHGDLSPGAAYVPNQQVHQWFVKSAIVAGLALLFALGPIAARSRASLASENDGSEPECPAG